MASNTIKIVLSVLETVTDLPRLKEVLWSIAASFYENYLKDQNKSLLQLAPKRKGTGDSETSLEGRGQSEPYADGTVPLRRAERREERKQKAEERRREAEEREREAAERERKAAERERKAAEKERERELAEGL